MTDHIDRAAEVIEDVIGNVSDVDDIARALDTAGLLVSPERDVAVAAKALRDAESVAEVIKEHAGGGNLVRQVIAVKVSALRDRADQIEREADR